MQATFLCNYLNPLYLVVHGDGVPVLSSPVHGFSDGSGGATEGQAPGYGGVGRGPSCVKTRPSAEPRPLSQVPQAVWIPLPNPASHTGLQAACGCLKCSEIKVSGPPSREPCFQSSGATRGCWLPHGQHLDHSIIKEGTCWAGQVEVGKRRYPHGAVFCCWGTWSWLLRTVVATSPMACTTGPSSGPRRSPAPGSIRPPHPRPFAEMLMSRKSPGKGLCTLRHLRTQRWVPASLDAHPAGVQLTQTRLGVAPPQPPFTVRLDVR